MGDNIEHIGKKIESSCSNKSDFTTLMLISKPVMLHFQMEQTCKMPKKKLQLTIWSFSFQCPVWLAASLVWLVGTCAHCSPIVFVPRQLYCAQWPCWAFFNWKILRSCSFCWLQFHILKQYMDFYERINGHSFFIEKVFSCFVGSSVF